ncbi:MAG: hypothetical protein FWE84_00950 [Firmicutes bacterium]|nr:hypothetical protein [Bacillota bacterium]
MKKFISLILSVLLCVVTLSGLSGCGLFVRNYERDYAQVIATIKSFTQGVTGERTVFDEKGLPVFDLITGEPVTEDVPKVPKLDEKGAPVFVDGVQVFIPRQYTSDKVEIYKSQLVNYTNYYLPGELQQNRELDVDAKIRSYLDTLVKIELLLIEADKLFDAGILYWTVGDVDEIQRGVYTAIGDSIFEVKNQILADNDLPTIPAKGGDPATDSTTYPLPPEDIDEVVSPRYPVEEKEGDNKWFDSWYTGDEWYIEGAGYKTAYPGLYGSERDRSLAAQAFAVFFEDFIEKSQNIIGVTKAQQTEIDEEIDDLKGIRDREGIEYVFPVLGKSVAAKLLFGNSHIKNMKINKLNQYVVKDYTSVGEKDVTEYYDSLLNDQIKKFVVQSNYDSAVNGGGDPILYYPSDRYVFVKHILIPFSAEQTTELTKIRQRETDEDKIVALRAKMAKEIPVYPHVNGENDVSNVTTVDKVMQEITGRMDFLKRSRRDAEREFDRFIYKYNTDPGIFGRETGYAVVYKLGLEESETYMIEFAEAARALRDNNEPGEIFRDKDGTPYCITDYGIHIMYYLMDPVAEETRGLNDYVTPGGYSRIYTLIEERALSQSRSGIYEIWEDRYLSDNSDLYLKKENKVIDSWIKEINKQLGR